MTITTAALAGSLLTDEMLAEFDERAPLYDRENRFFTEDFEELRASGYLRAAVPEHLDPYGVVDRARRRAVLRLWVSCNHRVTPVQAARGPIIASETTGSDEDDSARTKRLKRLGRRLDAHR